MPPEDEATAQQIMDIAAGEPSMDELLRRDPRQMSRADRMLLILRDREARAVQELKARERQDRKEEKEDEN